MRKIFLALPLLAVLAVSPARAEDKKPTPTPAEEKGVLCVWSRYVELRNFGVICSLDLSGNFQPLLDESIAAMDKFIVANSDITQAQLDEKKSALLKHEQDGAAKVSPDELQKTCTDSTGIAAGYRKLQSADPALVRGEIAKLLATPRKPAMDPCS